MSCEKEMENLAGCLRTAQLLYHDAHQRTSGPTFQQDHAWFGDAYAAAEGDFDRVMEKMLGSGYSAPDLVKLLVHIQQKLGKVNISDDGRPEKYYSIGYKLECAVCELCQQIDRKEQDVGIRNMVGDICDKAQGRKYQIGQRMGGGKKMGSSKGQVGAAISVTIVDQ